MTLNGIQPNELIHKVESKDAQNLYQQALNWLNTHAKKKSISIQKKTNDKIIEFDFVKNNAAGIDKKYYHAKYTIEIHFQNNEFRFSPKEIVLKLNSKYDMGWKEFDLTNGSPFFKKKGKVNRKYKDYLSGVMNPLNGISQELSFHLKKWPLKTCPKTWENSIF